jgi:hypothetical protein
VNAGLRKVALAAAILWACYCVLFCTDAGIEIMLFVAFAYGGVGVLGLWVIRLLVYALWTRRHEAPVRWRSWLLEPVFVALVAGAVLTGAAFRVRFAASWPFLAKYAHAVQAGRVKADGQHDPTVVGLFIVRETETLPGGIVRMITTKCGFDDCGIVYSRGRKPPRIGEDSYTALGGGWWQWWRSW